MTQPALFEDFEVAERTEPEAIDVNAEWGTFKDSLKAPIHGWFTYPAGFSYKAVEWSLDHHNIEEGMTVFDPFMGSGTTNLVSKSKAINSIGVEAHPFVFDITRCKLNYELDTRGLSQLIDEVIQASRHMLENDENELRHLVNELPELLSKCYADISLRKLVSLREAIKRIDNLDFQLIMNVGLNSLLRQVSSAATGWPYIAPNKIKVTSEDKDAYIEFKRQMEKMKADMSAMVALSRTNFQQSTHRIFNADSRDLRSLVENNSADHIFCSPPYLNNFDYSDRTRLETYFFQRARNWGDISRNIRTQLMTSATTQVNTKDERYKLGQQIRNADAQIWEELSTIITQLSEVKRTKGGKKNYDLMTAGYFNDIFQIVSETARILRPNSHAIFVLGDSAPYGVHIPTDVLIGRIGLAVGYHDFEIVELRRRGDKWKNNPQRHGVALRETMLVLKK